MQLYRHQESALESILSRDSTALLCEAGTGKTLMAIRAMEGWAERGEIKRVLVIAPLTLLRTWQSEVSRWWVSTAKPEIRYINYERTWREEDELKKYKPDLIICDEGHKIKGRNSKQSKACARLGKRAKKKLLLTGTPVSQSPLDVFGQYRFLDPSIFGTRWGAFAERYARFGGYGGFQIVGYQNLDELAEKAHSIAFRARKQDCLDLPPTTDKTVLVQLDAKERRAYAELRKHALTVLEGGDTCTAQMALVQLLHCQRATGGWVKTDDGKLRQTGSSKLQALLDVAEEQHATGRPLLVFCRFRHELAQVATALASIGTVAELHGDVCEAERAELVRMFQTGELDALVCQTSVGGVGLTLTASDCAVFYSVGYSLTEYEQARARINRIGQTLPATYVHLVAEGTVDEEVITVLSEKRAIADLVVDDLRDVVKRALMRGQTVSVG